MKPGTLHRLPQAHSGSAGTGATGNRFTSERTFCSLVHSFLSWPLVVKSVRTSGPPAAVTGFGSGRRNVIVNLSASPAAIGKGAYRRDLVSGQSARLICGYVYACACSQESTQDLVFSGHNLIAENGTILAESHTMDPDFLVSEMDVRHLSVERSRQTTFTTVRPEHFLKYLWIFRRKKPC